jgi:predicted nucleotidyltransferase
LNELASDERSPIVTGMVFDALHPPDRPQSWQDCDPDLRAYVLESLAAMELDAIGAYVHGSLAMRCFYRAKSDVDLLVVVPDSLSEAEREHAARALAERSRDRPIAGELELSVLTVEQAAKHEHPRPFEVHYSDYWTEQILAGQVDYAATNADPDLAAHLTVVRARGAAVYGPPPADVFAAVPHDDYLAAITADLHDVLSGDAPSVGALLRGAECLPSPGNARGWSGHGPQQRRRRGMGARGHAGGASSARRAGAQVLPQRPSRGGR